MKVADLLVACLEQEGICYVFGVPRERERRLIVFNGSALGARFTTVIFNDNDYGLISWKQRLSRGRSVHTTLGNPDFKAYAESFGIRGYRPRSVAELRSNCATLLGRASCVSSKSQLMQA
jgi:thiamine pyrophosphate-dependent acetolactate synthase large subunit-like protein